MAPHFSVALRRIMGQSKVSVFCSPTQAGALLSPIPGRAPMAALTLFPTPGFHFRDFEASLWAHVFLAAMPPAWSRARCADAARTKTSPSRIGCGAVLAMTHSICFLHRLGFSVEHDWALNMALPCGNHFPVTAICLHGGFHREHPRWAPKNMCSWAPATRRGVSGSRYADTRDRGVGTAAVVVDFPK